MLFSSVNSSANKSRNCRIVLVASQFDYSSAYDPSKNNQVLAASRSQVVEELGSPSLLRGHSSTPDTIKVRLEAGKDKFRGYRDRFISD